MTKASVMVQVRYNRICSLLRWKDLPVNAETGYQATTVTLDSDQYSEFFKSKLRSIEGDLVDYTYLLTKEDPVTLEDITSNYSNLLKLNLLKHFLFLIVAFVTFAVDHLNIVIICIIEEHCFQFFFCENAKFETSDVVIKVITNLEKITSPKKKLYKSCCTVLQVDERIDFTKDAPIKFMYFYQQLFTAPRGSTTNIINETCTLKYTDVM